MYTIYDMFSYACNALTEANSYKKALYLEDPMAQFYTGQHL